jgi:hypothetical protein
MTTRRTLRVGATVLILAVFAVGFWVGRATTPDDPAVLPKLVGLSQSQAECHLQRLGARWRTDIGTTTTRSFTACKIVQPDPKVVRQTPRPGTILDPRQVVQLVTTCKDNVCQ